MYVIYVTLNCRWNQSVIELIGQRVEPVPEFVITATVQGLGNLIIRVPQMEAEASLCIGTYYTSAMTIQKGWSIPAASSQFASWNIEPEAYPAGWGSQCTEELEDVFVGCQIPKSMWLPELVNETNRNQISPVHTCHKFMNLDRYRTQRNKLQTR